MNRYYDDMEQITFDAQVTACELREGNYHITLSETAFYPEKGGMAKDTGTINHYSVIDVYEKDDQIIHVIASPLAVGLLVQGKIDAKQRLHKCQVHTAQHILSYYIESRYRLITTSHHVSKDMAHITFSWLSNEDETNKNQVEDLLDLMAINDYANTMIRNHIPINIIYPPFEEFAPHQKKTNFQPGDEVRVVKLGEEDYNFCGCIHVPNTSYIQMIHVRDITLTKTGITITYQAGESLRQDHNLRMNIMEASSIALKANEYEITAAIENLLHQKQQLEQELYVSRQHYLDMIVDHTMSQNTDVYVQQFEHLSTKEGQILASRLTANGKIVYLLLKLDERCHVIFASPKGSNYDMKLDYAAFTETFGDVKGGGNSFMAQGGGIYREEYIVAIQKIAEERKQNHEQPICQSTRIT